MWLEIMPGVYGGLPMNAKNVTAANSDALIARLNQLEASLEDRMLAVVMYSGADIDKALNFCDALEIVRQLAEYQPECYTVDAVELLF